MDTRMDKVITGKTRRKWRKMRETREKNRMDQRGKRKFYNAVVPSDFDGRPRHTIMEKMEDGMNRVISGRKEVHQILQNLTGEHFARSPAAYTKWPEATEGTRRKTNEMEDEHRQCFKTGDFVKYIHEGEVELGQVVEIGGKNHPGKDKERKIIQKYILEAREGELLEIIKQSHEEGMVDFTSSLLNLVEDEYIHQDVALNATPKPEELKMRLKGIS